MSQLAHTELEQLQPLHAILEPEYPEDLARFAECLFLVLRERLPGDAHEHAALALAQVEMIRAELGGRQFYLSKGTALVLAHRDKQILAAFNGTNHAELAHEFGVTERHIYDVVAKRQRAEFMRRQQQIPFDD